MTPQDQFLHAIAKTLARASDPELAVKQFAVALKAEMPEIKIKRSM